jgi:hypothetical protein
MMSTSGMTFGSTIGSALSPLTETAMKTPAGPVWLGLVVRKPSLPFIPAWRKPAAPFGAILFEKPAGTAAGQGNG